MNKVLPIGKEDYFLGVTMKATKNIPYIVLLLLSLFLDQSYPLMYHCLKIAHIAEGVLYLRDNEYCNPDLNESKVIP